MCQFYWPGFLFLVFNLNFKKLLLWKILGNLTLTKLKDVIVKLSSHQICTLKEWKAKLISCPHRKGEKYWMELSESQSNIEVVSNSLLVIYNFLCFFFFLNFFSEITYYRWTFGSSSSFWQEMWSWKLDCCFCSRWFVLRLVPRILYSKACSMVSVP